MKIFKMLLYVKLSLDLKNKIYKSWWCGVSMSNEEIGAIIRQCRKSGNITLQELSNRTGLSAGYLSLLERGINSPTIENLNLICKSLGITMSQLILKLDAPKIVVHNDEREVIINNEGYLYEAATEGNRQMSCIVMTVNDTLLHTSNPHVADEIGFVIEGSISMNIDDNDYLLNPGSCIYIEAGTSHSYHKVSTEKCVTVWVYGTTRTANSPKVPDYHGYLSTDR